MVKVISHANIPYYPIGFPRLDKFIEFPGGEIKNKGIPNSTVWVFSSNASYEPSILGPDVGCGMAAFLIGSVDVNEAADVCYMHFKGKNILGRGNHFIDFASEITSPNFNKDPYNVLLIHTDGKNGCNEIPTNFRTALDKQKGAQNFRDNLATEITDLLKVSCEPLGNWPHNTVSLDEEGIIYRKGVVKVVPEKLSLLPANIGEPLWFYTVDSDNIPPVSSMPHATGRIGPTSQTKVSAEEAKEIRDLVYIPRGISDESLRSEHPYCFNDFEPITRCLGEHIVSVGTSKILSYVAKI